jgi:hypothetical protein
LCQVGPLGENQDPCGRNKKKTCCTTSGGWVWGVHKRHCQRREPLAVPRTLGIWGVMRRLGGVTLGLPLSDTRLLGHAAARISCSKNLDSKDYSATGQRGVDGERAVASATTSILHKAPNERNSPYPNIVNRSVRTLAAYTSTVTPKRRNTPQEAWERFQL